MPPMIEDILKTYLGVEECQSIRLDGVGLNGIYICVIDGHINFGSIAMHCLERTKHGAVHVICATKEFCSKLSNQIQCLNQNNIELRVVSSDTKEEERCKSCREWTLGNFSILVSTTCCLVGNENKKCRSIVGVGHLFNIACLVQACGRLRPSQRDRTCEARFFVNTKQPIPLPEDNSHIFGDKLSVSLFMDPKVLTSFYQEKSKCRQVHLLELLGSSLNEHDNCK